MSVAHVGAQGATTTKREQALAPHHRLALEQGSAIAGSVIEARGYWTARDWQELKAGGVQLRQAQNKVASYPALVLPLHTPDGESPFGIVRWDSPRVGRGGRAVRYETPAGVGLRIDCPPCCREGLWSSERALWITEGIRKADAIASDGGVAIAALGVDAWRSPSAIADLYGIPWKQRRVNIAFDSDTWTKPKVRLAVEALARWLAQRGAVGYILDWSQFDIQGPGKWGVDDYLAAGHALTELEAACVPAEKWLGESPATPTYAVELLDTPPPALTRPLALIDGCAYVAIWPWVRTTTTTAIGKDGAVLRLDPPRVTTERQLHVVRDDGAIFGPGGLPMAELGLDVRLGDAPRDSRLWSSGGVKAFARGERPDPRDVFGRITAAVDRFVSFERSLARQETMAELIGCYAMATWFLDGLSTTSYLWPNGDFGCGKTKLGTLVCEVAYLGEVILSASSFAALRDLADMGATLLFDDAEALADPKKADPDKRALLLGGHRKGAAVALKEPTPTGGWRTRWVSTYCTRLFTATRLPDAGLASRSIVVPLVRTADASKANADVLDTAAWPCDRRQLVDDLWAVALAHLAEMPAHEAAVNRAAPLIGRALEPWRPLLAVAHWLDGMGVPQLYERMVGLATAYQTERLDLEYPDHLRVIVRALVAAMPLVPREPLVPFEIGVGEITERANEIAVELDLADGDEKFTTERRVGRTLTQLRLKAAPRRSARDGRRRLVTRSQIESIARAYGVSLEMAVMAQTALTAVRNSHDELEAAFGQVTSLAGVEGASTRETSVTGVEEEVL